MSEHPDTERPSLEELADQGFELVIVVLLFVAELVAPFSMAAAVIAIITVGVCWVARVTLWILMSQQ